ncbi:hypothetical protein N9241_01145 [bacterium]|nr:hypothetical protein [bacterium]
MASEKEALSIEKIKQELEAASPSRRRRAFEKFSLAAIGSIPWIGGFISAGISLKTEEGGLRQDSLQTQWLEQHCQKIQDLTMTMNDVGERFEALGDSIDERVQSDEYLQLVQKAFRSWDHADTVQKRMYIRNLVVNSAGARICDDDVVRLFIQWLDSYHESHFLVIREIFRNPNITRAAIWENIHGGYVRDDSAEADLFKLVVRDLSTGGVIRQLRQTNRMGQFIRAKKPPRKHKGDTLETPFEDTKPYVLTEMGKQFVHYTMTDVVTQIEGSSDG